MIAYAKSSIALPQSNSQTAKEVFGGVSRGRVSGVHPLAKSLTNGTDGSDGISTLSPKVSMAMKKKFSLADGQAGRLEVIFHRSQTQRA